MKAFALACMTAWVASCGGSKPLSADGGTNTRRDGSVETVVDAGRDQRAVSDAPVDRASGVGGGGGAGGSAGTRGASSPDGSSDRPVGSAGSDGGAHPVNGDAASDAGGPDRTPGDAATTDGGRPSIGCGSAGLFDTGTSPLVNAFVTPDGIIVVRANSIALLGRDRSVKQMVTTLAPISTAAFDGQTLATADTANLNVYTTALVPQGTVPLRDACFDSFIAPGGVFVCQNNRPAALTFTTFDVRGRRFLKQASDNFTSAGQVMEQAPGTPYFALQLQSSPSIFVLWAADPDGTVRELGGVQAGDVLNTAFGFGGAPPSHLILPTGTLLRMLGPMCDGTATTGQSGCLQPDGTIGTLQTRDRFIALDSDGSGDLIGLVSHTGSSDAFDTAPCPAGCTLQKIDFPARTVIATQEHVLTVRTMLFLRDDPTCKMAVVGYQQPATSATPPTFPYRVDLLDY